jgi:hypothetical protein
MKALPAWVLLRLPLPLLLVAAAPAQVGAWVGERLTDVGYAHGLVKTAVIAWQSVLLRESSLLLFGILVPLCVTILQGARGRIWRVGAVASACLALALLRPAALLVSVPALGALAIVAAPAQQQRRWGARWRALAWLPGTELFFGPAVAAAVGGGPHLLRVGAALSALVLSGGWIIADTLTAFDLYEQRVFAPWPEDRVDPRVTTLLRAPPGIKCEFHDVDIVGDRAVVIAEGSERLWSVPVDGAPVSAPLPRSWGSMFGLVMDSETDPETGLTWHLNGPHAFAARRWEDGAWIDAGQSAPIAPFLHHVYQQLVPGRGLFAFTVGTKNTHEAPLLIELDLPALTHPEVRRLTLPGGAPLPTPRDIAWIPPLERFVLAPDFGDRLFLVRPGESVAEPWLEMPTLNGRLLWVPELGRLFVPLPDRPELWVVDPMQGVVERSVPTQPGVRAVAVDATRGLVLTASVLTGRVLVQRLEDGEIVDSFGTLMPMSRNLALIPERGEAILSTWTALYRIPYASPR